MTSAAAIPYVAQAPHPDRQRMIERVAGIGFAFPRSCCCC
jgi:hypothetical protein